jgi:hypothetical protein
MYLLLTLVTRYAQTPLRFSPHSPAGLEERSGAGAVLPGVILAVPPAAETASAMSVSQVVRGVGFSTGSAIGGLVLALFTPDRGGAFPADRGFGVAAWLGAAVGRPPPDGLFDLCIGATVAVLFRPLACGYIGDIGASRP